MRLRSRGLLVGGVDRDLYVPRRELEAALLDPLLSGGNVLLTGGPGSGKSTSMRKLATDLADRDKRVAWVNAALADSPAALLTLVAEALQVPPTRTAEDASAAELAAAIAALSDTDPACVLVDGPIATQDGRMLFGRLRDELWSLEHRWAVATTPEGAGLLRLPPADAFWDQVVTMPRLSRPEINALLERGLTEDERTDLGSLGWSAPDSAWPREVVRDVRGMFEGTQLEPPERVAELRAKRGSLDRVPAMVLAELEGLRRPAAASDPELGTRLGYSRAYIARGLAELEQHGLVVATPEAGSGRSGRPRKLYEPVLQGVA